MTGPQLTILVVPERTGRVSAVVHDLTAACEGIVGQLALQPRSVPRAEVWTGGLRVLECWLDPDALRSGRMQWRWIEVFTGSGLSMGPHGEAVTRQTIQALQDMNTRDEYLPRPPAINLLARLRAVTRPPR